jgi:hypothetical protein
MRISQTSEDLITHLKEQIDFLERSAKAYDEGYVSEAKRIATTLRVLLHDTKNSTSLLKLLGKNRIKFYNSSMNYESGLAPKMKLIIMVIKGHEEYFDDAFYKAPLDNLPPGTNVNKKNDFLQWWNQVVIIDQKKNKFSRKDLVISVSNQDGGAHIDPKLDNKYADLTRFNSLGWLLITNNVEKKFSTNPELASIRQICHEVLKTLNDEFPGIVSEAILKCQTNTWEPFSENGVSGLKGNKIFLNSDNSDG